MFGSSKRRVFKPTAYGTTRRTRRIPRWLVLMLSGVVLGAGGLLFLQKSYGPTRLTVEQSEQLHYDLNSANMDKQRLQAQLGQLTRDLKETRSGLDTQTAEAKALQDQVSKITADLQLFADTMPADPRGTSPGIRAASFSNDAGQLDYQLLIMQDEGKTEAFSGEVQLIVNGRYTSGKAANLEVPPFSVELEQYAHVHGVAPLPEGFTARQVTVKIIKAGNKQPSATRTLRVVR